MKCAQLFNIIKKQEHALKTCGVNVSSAGTENRTEREPKERFWTWFFWGTWTRTRTKKGVKEWTWTRTWTSSRC